MALIKCPECSHEVSTLATSCPNCGFPMSKYDALEKTIENSKTVSEIVEIDPEIASPWIKKYEEELIKKERGITRAYIIMFAVSFMLLMLGYGIGEPILALLIPGYLLFFTAIGCLVVMLIMKNSRHITVRIIDGYTVLLCWNAFEAKLVVEDVIQNKVHNCWFGILYGTLPNNRQIWAFLTSLTGFNQIGVDEIPDNIKNPFQKL